MAEHDLRQAEKRHAALLERKRIGHHISREEMADAERDLKAATATSQAS